MSIIEERNDPHFGVAAKDIEAIGSIRATLARLTELAKGQVKNSVVTPEVVHAEFVRMAQAGEGAPLVMACDYALSSEIVPEARRKNMDAYAAEALGTLCREGTIGALFIDYVTHLQQRLVEPNSPEAGDHENARRQVETSARRQPFGIPPFALQ